MSTPAIASVADLGVDVLGEAARIGRDVAAPVAEDVDAGARFPQEAIGALRDAALLSALVPHEFGGAGAGIDTVAAAARALGRHCSSTAMIFAMHQIQVACLVRHGHTPLINDYIRRLVTDQPLLASATTELGVGGDTRSSLCAVERQDNRFTLEKQAPVISYGAYADAVLATARRHPDSPSSDQVLVLCLKADTELEQRGEWDALGFRGTCSPGFRLIASGDESAICADPYADILAQTMLPVSHILWASLWLGIADAAVAKCRRFVQSAARSAPGTTPPGALRLAEMLCTHQQFEGMVLEAARNYERDQDDPERVSSPTHVVGMNTLKVAASDAVVDIVSQALAICGMAGYRLDSPYALGRLLRDAHGSRIMVNNDRILANTASQVLLQRDLW